MPNEYSRPDANSDEQAYSLTVEDAAVRYDAAGQARTIRAIQKYCARGDLECTKVETEVGFRFLITRRSVNRHIEQIAQRTAAHIREQPRPDASVRSSQDKHETEQRTSTNDRDHARMDAPSSSFQDRYIMQIETENKFLREQNTVLLSRIQETNVLMVSMQKMLAPLLNAPERQEHRPRDTGDFSSPNA